MKSITLLQLGDIHFPEAQAQAIVDYKDEALPSQLVDSLAPRPLQRVVREIVTLEPPRQPDAILICGDLTSRGDLVQYRRCVEFLQKSLGLGTQWTNDQIHVVPGNHDVNRHDCNAHGSDLFTKFAPLAAAWAERSLPILQPALVRATAVTRGQSEVRMFSMNSCIGCGERRSLPQAIEKQLKKILDDHIAAEPDAGFSIVGEQLDTPAFLEEHVAALVERVKSLQPTSIPVVLAHHNLLPQATVRIDLYTEVINGGLVRSRLATGPRPLIYCHGHIHDDPIELVSLPKFPDAGLISISAPELTHGFNLLGVEFSQGGIPMGLSITPYRVRPDGAVTPADPTRVSLVTPRDCALFATDLLRTALSLTTATPKRFKDLVQQIRSRTAASTQTRTIENVLREAEWLGIIHIQDRDRENIHWTIKRLEP